MTRSLVIAPQWIGDAVMSQPLIARLAARGEALTVAALPSVAPVFRAMPDSLETIELPFAHGRLDLAERRRLAIELRGRFDIAYVLPNSIKAALLPAFARIPRRIGYQGEGRMGLLNERLRNPDGRPPMVAHYLALAGPGADPQARPQLRRDAALEAAALRRGELAPGRFIAFAPGAEYGPAKRWPAERYAALAARLHAHDGSPVALLGSPTEAALCDAIAAAVAPGVARVLAGRLSLAESIALIGAARGLVSNDSGLMHVAAAFGIPQVAVFGSTSPEHTPPLNARARVLWVKDELKLACMPCFERECRYGHYGCLTGVEVERVERAFAEAAHEGGLPAR